MIERSTSTDRMCERINDGNSSDGLFNTQPLMGKKTVNNFQNKLILIMEMNDNHIFCGKRKPKYQYPKC